MSFIARVWNAMRNPARYVGRDLQGNKFYEAPSPNDPSRPKRIVQYQDPQDVWNYIGGGKRLAVQWSAWLTYTRMQPPTLEELHADAARQQRVLANVAVIDARDEAEAAERLRIRQRDAQQALIDAAAESSGKRLMQESATTATPDSNEPATSSSSSLELSTNSKTTTTAKVLPPTFLTPATPQKPKIVGKFTLPPADWNATSTIKSAENSASVPPVIHQEKATEKGKKKSETSIPTMPSRPVSETESWTPKAIKRG